MFSVISIVRDGCREFFWLDKCCMGLSLSVLAPALCKHVQKRALKQRTVQEALTDGTWIQDIRGDLSIETLLEYLQLWEILSVVNLSVGVEWGSAHLVTMPSSSSREITIKSVYRHFLGAVDFEPWKEIWKTWAPPCCKFFAWLASLNRSWTMEHLARQGLNHPEKCTCDQDEETKQHLLTACVFSRQVWLVVLSLVGLPQHTPGPNDMVFTEW